MFKEWSYENVQVGDEFTSTQLLITPELIEDYAYAVEYFDPLFAPDPETGEQLAYPTIAGNQVLSLRKEKYIVRGAYMPSTNVNFSARSRPGCGSGPKGRLLTNTGDVTRAIL